MGVTLILANHGHWIRPTTPHLTVITTAMSPSLKRVQEDIIASFKRFQQWRAARHRMGDVLEDTVQYFHHGPHSEPHDVWLEVARLWGLCLTATIGQCWWQL